MKPFAPGIISRDGWQVRGVFAPDESYLTWDSKREGGYGGKELYISFRQQDSS